MTKSVLQGIYTYEKKEQEMIDYKFVPENVLDTKDTLVTFITDILTDEERAELRKISVCITCYDTPPKWYTNCNGKFYFIDGKLDE